MSGTIDFVLNTLGVSETQYGFLAEIKPMEPEPDHTGVGKRLLSMSVLRLTCHWSCCSVHIYNGIRHAKNLLKLTTALLCLTPFVTPSLASDKPVLTIYTYDSFASEWGPGPEIERLLKFSVSAI